MKNLKKQGANFYGFKRIDASGKHHFQLTAIRGSGDLSLTEKGIVFKQWATNTEYAVSLDNITKVDVRLWHNMKMKWPSKVLRIYFKEGDETRIMGIAPGGKLSIVKGWQDEAYEWKERIEELLKGN